MDTSKIIEQERITRLSLPGIDLKDPISFQNSLSSGVNKLPIPQLYYHQFGDNIIDWKSIHNYTNTAGSPLLVEAIKIYEKISASGDNIKDISSLEHICITTGASAAIAFYFRYFALRYPKQDVLLLGHNYYLFYECMVRNKIDYHLLISSKENRIAPTVDEIISEVNRHSYKLLVLTMPFNPSGEVYTESEMRTLIRALKDKKIFLLYDKCQMEDFADVFTYVNVNAIAYKENYLKSLIIINSFSKTRSLAGARIGYICAEKEIINFINHENEYYYFNHPQVYIVPLVLDQMCKSIHLVLYMQSNMNFRKLIKMYRNAIVLTSGYDYYKEYFKPYFHESTIMETYEKLKTDITTNYNAIYKNYQYTKQVLGKSLESITELQGGFNFYIKLKNTSSKDQLNFCASLSKHIKAIILPESFYNGSKINQSSQPFWLRITCAYDSLVFCPYIDQIKQFMSRGETDYE